MASNRIGARAARRRGRFGPAALASALGLAAAFAACSSTNDAAPSGGFGGSDVAHGGAGGGTSCATPSEGCPCDAGAAAVDCGDVVSRTGDYVSCSMGKRGCEAGVWGACLGDMVGTKFAPVASPGLSTLGLASSPTACGSNPCDPYCTGYNDTPSGLDVSANPELTDDGTGISLAPHVGSSTSPCTGISVTPATATVTVTQIASSGAITTTSSPSPVKFTASFVPSGCFASGTAPALWTVDNPTISAVDSTGTFTLASPLAGPIHVAAYAGSWNTVASPSTVTVVVNATDVTAAPMGYTAATFAPTSVTPDAINVLYPYNNTVLPLGLPSPILQWDNLGVAANAVKVTLRYPADGSKFTWSQVVPELQTAPTGLAGQPRALIPQAVWKAFEQTAKGSDATFAIQRVVGGVLRKENTAVTIHFATDQLKGTVYYNSYGTNLASNYCCTKNGARFGGATLAVPASTWAPTLVAGDNSTCVVCHSVSANGATLTTQSGSNYNWTLDYNLSTLVATGMSPADGSFAWGALSPDGTYMFSNTGPLSGTSSGSSSKVFTVPGGAAVAVTGLPTFGGRTPAFSPDAAHVAFQHYSGTVNARAADAKSLGAIDYNPTTKAFSNFQILATPGSGGVGAGTVYYPAYLPSGNGVVYHLETTYNGRDPGGTRSGCDSSGTCNNNGSYAELWWVDVASKTSARLDQLNGAGYLPTHATAVSPAADAQLNYEPTVNPRATGGYSWVVFTSRRVYGNIATVNPFWSDPRYQDISAQPTTKKLWVAAIDTNPVAGRDPSHPAFYLPGQELLAGNSRGYWVLDPCKPAGTTAASVCDTTLDCCAATTGQPAVSCSLDSASSTTKHCVGGGTNACAADGGACTSNSQCCNYPTSTCAQGVCQAPPAVATYNAASYSRDYDGSSCPSGTHAVWQNFGLEAMTPASSGGNWSNVTLNVQTADTVAGLASAPVVPLGVMNGPPADHTTSWTDYNVAAALTAASTSYTSKLFVRVTMTLNPSSDKLTKPTVTNWRQQFDCAPSE